MPLDKCFFVTDLHGKTDRYDKLFEALKKERPDILFVGGDILPHSLSSVTSVDPAHHDFINDYLVPGLLEVKDYLGESYPEIYLILGNDDARFEEAAILDASIKGIWKYIHDRKVKYQDYTIYGYAFVPPSPFLLKDWEKYDVSRYYDPGCVSPEEGRRSIPVSEYDKKYSTIKKDLENLIDKENAEKTIFLFHSPPYDTKLDRAALDGKMIDHAPVDVHVGSVAIRDLIESFQPLLTLHGHIHESARITHSWSDKLGRTLMFNGANDSPELALIKFTLSAPEKAERVLL